MGSPPTLCSTWAPQVAGEDSLGNEYNEPTQGEFAVMHVAARAAILQFFSDGDELDHDGAPMEYGDPADIANETPDPADIADADAFEELAQNGRNFATTTPDQLTINESPDTPDAPERLPNDSEAGNTEAAPAVVVDHFPFASAGAPLHGMPHGNPIYDSQQGADGDSIWSPFTSQCDWLFARWAKMRGPTSSAVTELLAIPEVWTSPLLISTLLI